MDKRTFVWKVSVTFNICNNGFFFVSHLLFFLCSTFYSALEFIFTSTLFNLWLDSHYCLFFPVTLFFFSQKFYYYFFFPSLWLFASSVAFCCSESLWRALDTSLQLLASREGIRSQAEALIQTPFLPIYYLSSPVLLTQTFIALASIRHGYDTDNRTSFGSRRACENNRAGIAPSWNYNSGEICELAENGVITMLWILTGGSRLMRSLLVISDTSFTKLTLVIAVQLVQQCAVCSPLQPPGLLFSVLPSHLNK